MCFHHNCLSISEFALKLKPKQLLIEPSPFKLRNHDDINLNTSFEINTSSIETVQTSLKPSTTFPLSNNESTHTNQSLIIKRKPKTTILLSLTMRKYSRL